MLTMESVDLSDPTVLNQVTTVANATSDKSPISLEQIRLEEMEERWEMQIDRWFNYSSSSIWSNFKQVWRVWERNTVQRKLRENIREFSAKNKLDSTCETWELNNISLPYFPVFLKKICQKKIYQLSRDVVKVDSTRVVTWTMIHWPNKREDSQAHTKASSLENFSVSRKNRWRFSPSDFPLSFSLHAGKLCLFFSSLAVRNLWFEINSQRPHLTHKSLRFNWICCVWAK